MGDPSRTGAACSAEYTRIVFFLPLLAVCSLSTSVHCDCWCRYGLACRSHYLLPGILSGCRSRCDWLLASSSTSSMVLLLGSLFGIILSLSAPLKIGSHESYQQFYKKILLMRSHLLKLLFVSPSRPTDSSGGWTWKQVELNLYDITPTNDSDGGTYSPSQLLKARQFASTAKCRLLATFKSSPKVKEHCSIIIAT